MLISHEYIVSIEVWADGRKMGRGSMSVTIDSDSASAPDASSFRRQICDQGAKQSNCDPSNVIIVGVFKL